LFLSDYVNDSDRKFIEKVVKTYDLNNYRAWTYEQMPVGIWALDVLRNNYVVGDETLIDNYKNKLLKLLFNIILCIEGLKKVLSEINPDIIISNDSFYYPWSILEFLAKKNNIAFYSYWVPVGSNGECAYAKNCPAMAIDLNTAWQNFKNIPLKDDEEAFIDDIFKYKKRGKMMFINTADPDKDIQLSSSDSEIFFTKPTALLSANVVWDLAALNKEVQFKNMFDWIIQTIEFFKNNPQWQLIIKPHTVEENRHIPVTSQRVKDFVESSLDNIPENVFVLDAKTKYDIYYFFDKIKVGLVFTSTSGLEMACYGIPVVPAGKAPYFNKGFTYDTNTREEYFEVLSRLLETNFAMDKSKEYSMLAKKFFKLNFFHYYMKTNFFDYVLGSKNGLNLKVSSADDLIPGKNSVLDYICNSILKHEPFISENRWPPFTSEGL